MKVVYTLIGEHYHLIKERRKTPHGNSYYVSECGLVNTCKQFALANDVEWVEQNLPHLTICKRCKSKSSG